MFGVYWEREDCFSLGMLPLKGYLGSSRWSYTHAQTGYTKLIQWVLNQKRVHEVGKEKWGDKEEIKGEGMEWNRYNIIYMNKYKTAYSKKNKCEF